ICYSELFSTFPKRRSSDLHAREAGQGGIAVLAVMVKEPGQVVLEERPRPVRPPGCALIRVTLAGVCQTDLELVRGYMGFTGILGDRKSTRLNSSHVKISYA